MTKCWAFVLRTTDVVNEAHNTCHQTFPVATALGRVLTATLVLGAMLKGDESVTVQVRGDGIIQGIVAVADLMAMSEAMWVIPMSICPDREQQAGCG